MRVLRINYMLSTVFFLASRLSKATIGLAKFDSSINNIQERITQQHNENKQPCQKLHSKLKK